MATTSNRRLSLEAGVSLGWDRWTGSKGRSIAMDRFGASAPGGTLFEQFGFTANAVVKAVHEMLQAG